MSLSAELKSPDKPIIMGVVNVTPDSFSDGGQFLDPQKAIDHGHDLIEQGAHILDIGGESTRPGAESVSLQEEQDRILPVIEALSNVAFISVDTRHSDTMRCAIKAGAKMVNDVNALRDDGAVTICAEAGVFVCLMHMMETPKTMQVAPHYDDVVLEVSQFLIRRAKHCITGGVAGEKICIDPGIGFGKTLDHNLSLLKNIKTIQDSGFSVLLGTSRKSFIEKAMQRYNHKSCPADQRLAGSLASVLWGLSQGVTFFRVHDVKETQQAITLWQEISKAV